MVVYSFRFKLVKDSSHFNSFTPSRDIYLMKDFDHHIRTKLKIIRQRLLPRLPLLVPLGEEELRF